MLEDISCTCLCELPEDDSITVDDFLKRTEDTCSAVIVSLSRYGMFKVPISPLGILHYLYYLEHFKMKCNISSQRKTSSAWII